MLHKSVSYILVLLLGAAVFFSGCSTEKNTFVNRSYHNVTARYNPYFNGNESIKQGLKKIQKTPDNYSLMLPVFQHSMTEAAGNVVGEMDKSILKASKVIKMHSITAKPKRRRGTKTEKQKEFYSRTEFCNWVDDSYLMMGKAHFFKHDFFLAAQAFEYVATQFSTQPIRYEGYIWLARTYAEQENYRRAKEILDLLEGEKDFPKDLKDEFASTYADLYMKKKQYNDAIPKLQDAINATRHKPDRARYTYILAQIYQNLGDAANASRLYGEVVKNNPNYEMAFSAKINRATSYDAGAGDVKEIRKQLNKMLKDDKNIEYQDQIYYALGNIAFKENTVDEAIKNYKLSTEKSIANSDQKALSFLALADIYFAKPDYVNAQAYYDSCMALLDKNYPDYSKLQYKTDNLTKLVGFITTVEREDSLQKIAQMPEKQRLSFIDGIIEKLKEDERRQKEEEQQRRMNSMLFEQSNPKNSMNNMGGKWYFYNPQAVQLGKSQFANKWGNRKLEDNWRRKNKSVVDMGFGTDETATTTDSTENRVTDNKTREFYLQDLPVNDTLMAESHESIKDALYKLAIVYKDDMKDFDRAIQAYEELIRRYPENEYLLAVYYDLYLIYTAKKDAPNAEKYKNLVIEKYPDSKYARMLKNPDYYKELLANKNKVVELYTKTYSQYRNGEYNEVIATAGMADTAYTGDELIPKFLFLQALSHGELGDTVALKEKLISLVKEYPDNEVKQPAMDILAVLNNGKPLGADITGEQIVAVDTATNEEELYTFNPKATHFYISVLNNDAVDVNRLKFDMANYNFDNYSMIDFNISAVMLTDKEQMITIKSFESLEQGLNYYKAIITGKQVYKNISPANYRHFIISSDNYAVFYKDKAVDTYLKYFRKHYLQEQ